MTACAPGTEFAQAWKPHARQARCPSAGSSVPAQRGQNRQSSSAPTIREDTFMSPRASATANDLLRIGLFSTLPGETIAKLATRMTRGNVAPGKAVVSEGEAGDRFYVVRSGMLAVSQSSRGARGMLRPGDYFGEVGAAMEVPRTATVRAFTPSVVASCDRETFDECIRPLFADDPAG